MQQDYLSVQESYPKAGLDFTPYFCPSDKSWDQTAKWELREVAITNEKGEFVFKQEAVESPKEWSQTATNIVASKYFRGIQGTDKREASVRGLISRVITAITDHGKKEGYFNSPQSAEIFKNDLGYMLLHQMVSFNSPVWFNIGASDVRQQASACLSFNSKISTPKGVIAIGEIVNKKMLGLEIFDRDSLTKIRAVKENGIKTVYKVTTKSSTSLEATGDHLVWATDSVSGVSGWKQVSQLRQGLDYLTRRAAVYQGHPQVELDIVTSISILGQMPVYDIQTESSNFLCNQFVVHNCFILNVEDDMRSILQWVTDEAMIFKYGSGAGANLSKLREENANLSGGGPASGPISFMKIADSAAGVVKSGGTCLAPHQRVYTNEGPIAVSELAKKDKFITLSYDPPAGRYKAKWAKAWLAGTKQVVRVNTDKGSFEISYDHPVKLSTGEYRPAGELVPGNSLWQCSIGKFGLQERAMVRSRYREGKDEFLARLLAKDILGDDLHKKIVHHKDGNPKNNTLANLIVMTQAEHAEYHNNTLAQKGEHVFQNNTFPHANEKNGMHHLSDFWNNREKVETYKETQGRILLASGRSQEMQVVAVQRKMINTAFAILNAGGSIDTFDQYYDNRKAILGQKIWRKDIEKKIARNFGSYESFKTQVANANHRVMDIEQIGVMPVYDVEVICPTLDDKSINTGHNFVIWPDNNISNSGIVVSNTRRAAKMVILDADHPDVEDFIECKVKEEAKARALIAQGYDGSYTGEAYTSIYFQNANNSVRVSDEFMKAVENDGDWELISRGKDKKVIKTIKAKKLFREIAQAAWSCGDPGVQFGTTINDWHTVPNTDAIYGSNPCFPETALVHTNKGLIPIGRLYDRYQSGETIKVYTNNITAEKGRNTTSLSTPLTVECTGFEKIISLFFSNGQEFKCTPTHRLWTLNRGYVAAQDLTGEDYVFLNETTTLATRAKWQLPVQIKTPALLTHQGGVGVTGKSLPTLWSTDLGEIMGHLVGDGCMTDKATILVYGKKDIEDGLINRHEQMLQKLLGRITTKKMLNGTMQLASGSGAFRELLLGLGITAKKAAQKRIPESIFAAPIEVQTAFLKGLFGADGCATRTEAGKASRYVGLSSCSNSLLQDVQILLSTFNIHSKIYKISHLNDNNKFSYTRINGTTISYKSQQTYDLRITGLNLVLFLEKIGFSLDYKNNILREIIATTSRYITRSDVRLLDRIERDPEFVYNLNEPINHSYIVDGIVVSNCSEFVFLNNSACNLASFNLLKFYSGGKFNGEAFVKGAEVMITAMEILVGYSDYPTPAITQNSRDYRPLGLGYTNLGALLMTLGLPYDSDEGRALAATITAVLHASSYRQSAKIAGNENIGPFAGYANNAAPMQLVMENHAQATADINESLLEDKSLLDLAKTTFEECLSLGKEYGYRNAQATLLAPVGTISFMMDADTTGIEPDLALVKYKKLVGGGLLKMVNHSVLVALEKLGYPAEERELIQEYINANDTIEGCELLKEEHLPVFDCAFSPADGSRSIDWRGHIKMMAATQPFLSGAISKTCNVPKNATIEDIEDAYMMGWKLGCKAIAVYRDGCKESQPMSTSLAQAVGGNQGVADAATSKEQSTTTPHLAKRSLPKDRISRTHKFRIGENEGYLVVSLYENGDPGEIFIIMSKAGSSLQGFTNTIAILISMALQYGVPLQSIVEKLSHTTFAPSGFTGEKDLPTARSVPDYIARWLDKEFLNREEVETSDVAKSAELPQVKATINEPKQQIKLVPSAMGGHDADTCTNCGSIMIRSGACFVCQSCGETSGCG